MTHKGQLRAGAATTARWRVCVMALAVACIGPARGDDVAPVAPIPINVAEAIIESFWSPGLSGFDEWAVDDGADHGLAIKQNWAAVDFEWTSKPSAGPALRLSKRFDVDCRRYDRLVVRLAPPKNTVVRVTALTDQGERAFASEPALGEETEFAVELDGACRIDTVTLAVEPRDPGSAGGWLRWVGLQNTGLIEHYLARWDYSGKRWGKYLQDESAALRYEPLYGIFVTTDELAELRREHEESVKDTGRSRFTDAADAARGMEFEKGIHEFVRTGGDVNAYGRTRDPDQAPLPGNVRLALAGLVLRDAGTLRAAARFALSLAMSEHWEYGFMSCFPGGPWEDRAFRRSYVAEDVAYILDVAGEIFSDVGRTYVMRRLAEEGIGPINYVTWRHEYVFHCNQLAFFNTGRMCSYLVLEREWPRVKPYTDLAYRDALDNLDTVIMPDGGYLEGPSYLAPTVRQNYKALNYYSRARGLELSSIMPEVLKRTADFAALVASTTSDDVIAFCDAGPEFSTSALDVLVKLMPGSYWTAMYNKQRVRRGQAPLAEGGPPLPAFIALPDTGPMASTRKLGGHLVKLFIMGHKAGADHTHEDKGSFVLEFAGETFAMDLGICDYEDPMHHQYKHCQRHNMLAPVGTGERAHPERPISVDVKPAGTGDETAFHAEIDATPGWEGYYKKWVRRWDSPAPDRLVIRDEYELAAGDGVEFYWQSKLPCVREGQTVTITGARGTVTLKVPEGCEVRIDTLPLHGDDDQFRIAIGKKGTDGTLEIGVALMPSDPEGKG